LKSFGWDRGSFNDYRGDQTSPADALHDPLTYIEIFIIGRGIVRIAAPIFYQYILPMLCADGDCGNEVATVIRPGPKQVTVLGRYPDYINIADDVGGKVFSIDVNLWNSLSEAERWALNQQFLDQCVAKGDYFYLASGWANAGTGYYWMELNYLFSLGYTLSPNGLWLIPPGG
jgi:hypothetical protein